MDVIMTTVKNVVIYLILITVVMNLLGNSSFKKYIGIFTGMILIVIAISPLLSLMKLDKNMDYYLDANRFLGDTQEMNSELSVVDEKQQAIIIEEYKQELKKQVAELLTEMDYALLDFQVSIAEEGEEYGGIDQMALIVAKGDAGIETAENPVQKVHIDQIAISETTEKEVETQQKDSAETSLIKKEIAKHYELDQSQISVEIQEN